MVATTANAIDATPPDEGPRGWYKHFAYCTPAIRPRHRADRLSWQRQDDDPVAAGGEPAGGHGVVIVNEFGEVGLDHALLEASDESIVDLSCGCICCTIRGDLVSTLVDLYERRAAGEIRQFKRVVLETTGLADPAPIIHTLMQEPLVFERFRLARWSRRSMRSTAWRRWIVSRKPSSRWLQDALLVTKTDIANDSGIVATLQSRLAEINPSAERRNRVQGETDPAFLFADGIYDPHEKGGDVAEWLSEAADRGHFHDVDGNRHGDGIVYADPPGPVSRGSLGAFMQMLADQKGDDLLRLKGLVLLADDPDRPKRRARRAACDPSDPAA